jgi:hypothetical protein
MFSLWVSSACVAVEEFGHEKEHGVLFVETLRVFTASDAMASMTTSYSCDQEPDLAEAYFGLLSTFIRCCPKVMSQYLPLLDLHLDTKYSDFIEGFWHRFYISNDCLCPMSQQLTIVCYLCELL